MEESAFLSQALSYTSSTNQSNHILSSQLRLNSRRTLLNHRVHQRSNPTANPNSNRIAILEVNRRLLDEADAFGCAGHDDGAGEEGGALREEGDGLADGEELVSVVSGGGGVLLVR